MADVQFVQQLVQFLFAANPVEIGTVLEDRQYVFFNGQLAKNRRFLRQVAEPH